MARLLDLPEELLEIIVSLISVPTSCTENGSKLTALHPIFFTHSSLYRIGSVFLYHAISLKNCKAAYLLCRTLYAAPHYAGYIRELHSDAIFPSIPFILRHIAQEGAHIELLSLALDAPPSGQTAIYAEKHASEL